MAVNVFALAAPIVGKVAPAIIKKLKDKISPDEIRQAILAGIKAASAEDESLPPEQQLFCSSKLDSIN